MFADRYLRWDTGIARPPRGNQRSVLWPVYVWTVMAPDRMPSALNVFQEAILGLLHTGLRDLDELAKSLDLDRDLVAFILATQLQPNGWVDSHQQVTPLGVQVLLGAGIAEPDLVVQYAFQDAVTGYWLPRLAKQLPELEPLRGTAGVSPEFVIDRDKGSRIRPFALLPQVKPGNPEKAGAKLALRQFQRDLRRVRFDESEYVHDSVSDDFDFVYSTPTSAYVWCELFTNPMDLEPWLVSDPWRVTEAAVWLRKPLLDRLGQFPGLARRISELIPDTPEPAMSVGDWLGQLELRVELELADLPHLVNQPLIRGHIARVLRQLRRLESQERVQQEELASLAQESISALEAVLKWVLEKWPADTRQWPGGREPIGTAPFADLSINSPLSSVAMRILGGQSRDQIRSAARYRDRAIKALLVAALFSTNQHADHPFIELSDSTLQVDQLLHFVPMRNDGSHASGQKLDPASIFEMAQFAIDWHEQFKSHY